MGENMERRGTEIILPVGEKTEELLRCVGSVLRHTDLEKDRLVLVDGGKLEPGVRKTLEEMLGGQCFLLEGDGEKGFFGAVNAAISQTERDLVILHPQAVVTEGWLDSLAACAWARAETGSASPWTNFGSGEYTMPVPARGSGLEETEDFARVIRAASAKQYPEMTAFSRICAYLKREMIEETGLFDPHGFEGEDGPEIDYSWRAAQKGWRHALCDDAYVLWQGEQPEVQPQREKINQVLREKYPVLFRINEDRGEKRQMEKLRQAVSLLSGTLKNGKSILYILHNDYHTKTTQAVGGTELHVADLEETCREKYNVIVAARAGDRLVFTVHAGERSFSLEAEIGEAASYYTFRNQRLREIWETVLEGLGIAMVHVHHLMGLSLDIFEVCREKGIPAAFTMHDFFCVCPTIKLLSPDNRTCLGNETPEKCAACLAEKNGIQQVPDYIAAWRKHWREALRMADLLITPSEAAREIVCSYYPEFEGKIRVIPHGTGREKEKGREETALPEAEKHRTLRVGIIGNNTIEKGSLLYREAIRQSGRELSWFVFGSLTPPPEEGAVEITGPYPRDRLQEMLKEKQIDVICMMAIWPETFSYTLSEAWKAGIPVIGTELGAIGERIRESGAGWVLPREAEAEDVTALLKHILNSPEELAEKKRQTSAVKIRTVEEMAAEYHEIYDRMMRPVPQRRERWPEIAAMIREREDGGEPLNHSSARELMHMLEAREEELRIIKAAKGYRVLESLRKAWLGLKGKK